MLNYKDQSFIKIKINSSGNNNNFIDQNLKKQIK